MTDQNENCCCTGSGCCTPAPAQKKITVDFLYLDLSVCERCRGTDSNLDDALFDVSAVLSSAGFDVVVNKVNINSAAPVSYTHLRAHETDSYLVCRLLLE